MPADRAPIKGDSSRFFRSELVAAGLEKARALPAINASEVTPIERCRSRIDEPNDFLLKGSVDAHIKRFKTADPSDWKE